MPNWCENNLTIIGEEELVSQFLRENIGDTEEQKDVLLFSNALPVAEGQHASDIWGTKWLPITNYIGFSQDESLQYKSDKVITRLDIAFDSAWSPPLGWLQEVASKYKGLMFNLSYVEYGIGFLGRDSYIFGELSESYEGDVSYPDNEEQEYDDAHYNQLPEVIGIWNDIYSDYFFIEVTKEAEQSDTEQSDITGQTPTKAISDR